MGAKALSNMRVEPTLRNLTPLLVFAITSLKLNLFIVLILIEGLTESNKNYIVECNFFNGMTFSLPRKRGPYN